LEVTQELIKHLQASRNEAHDRISMLERDLDDNACNELRVRNYELMLNVDQLRHHITTLNSEKRDLEDQVFHLQNEIFLKNADLKKSEKLSENRRLELLERRPGGTVIRFYQEGPDIPAEIYRLSNELRKLTEDVWKLEGMYLHEKNNSRRLEEAYRFYNGAFTQHETLIREFFQEMNTINSWQNVMEGRSEIPRQERLSETEILRCRNNFMRKAPFRFHEHQSY
jgi:chromosome segregation ATPase